MQKISLGWIACGIGLVLASWSCDSGNSSGAQYNGGGAPGTNGQGGAATAAACVSCGTTNCPTEAKTCMDLPVCKKLAECTFACASTDAACKNACTTAAASDSAAIVAAANYLACITTECTDECFSTNTSGSGGAGSTATNIGGTKSATGGAGTGGAPVVYRCQGTNTVTACAQCSGTAPSCNCNAIPGCSGTTNFTCGGTPTFDCTELESFTECATFGCTIDYAGTTNSLCYTPTCASLSSNANCVDLPGCSITETYASCSGTPTPCTSLGSSNCAATPGCKWVPVQ